MNVIDALRSVNNYPIPTATIAVVAGGRLLDLTAEADEGILMSREFQLAKADLLYWLSIAPNVSQGEQSYSFTDDDRKRLRKLADGICEQYGDEGTAGKVKYGYKGSRL